MAEVKKIDTSKYKQEGKIQIDDMIWSVALPGAGVEMKMSKVQRRLKWLDKKIEADDYTEADIDKYDELEDWIYNLFKTMFKDDTKDNSQVNKWIEETPLGKIIAIFEDIKEQAKDGDPTSD